MYPWEKGKVIIVGGNGVSNVGRRNVSLKILVLGHEGLDLFALSKNIGLKSPRYTHSLVPLKC